MKGRRFLFIPVGLAAAVVFVLFVPVVLEPSFENGATAMVCNSRGCINFVQIDSISYRFGGWGAYFQTGVNYYTVDSWMCSCPSIVPGGENVPCCVPPYAGIIWPIVFSLTAGVIASTAIFIWDPSNQKHPTTP